MKGFIHMKCAHVLVALSAALMAGCATVKYSDPSLLEGVAVKGTGGRAVSRAVLVDTSGYYFLWTVPLVSGDLRWNDETQTIEGGCRFFRDQVGVSELQDVLLKIAEQNDCDLVDVFVQDSDSSYAGTSYSGIVGACFGSSHMSMSAILVPRNQDNTAK